MSAPVLSRTSSLDGDGTYLRRLTRAPLLTHEAEWALADLVQAGRRAQDILDGTAPRDGRSDAALRTAIRQGRTARDSFIEANLRLVTSMARRYTYHGMPLDDLIQEGTIGLTRAVDKFDSANGVYFATYASWWIRQALTLAVDSDRVMTRPAEVEAALRKIHAIERDLTDRAQLATVEAVAAAAGCTVAEVKRLRGLDHTETSLDVRLSTDAESSTTLGDTLADPDAHAAFAAVEEEHTRAALREALNAALAGMTPDQRQVIQLRFGLHGSDPLSLEETATRMGIDRLAVRRLEATALQVLRTTTATSPLHEHL